MQRTGMLLAMDTSTRQAGVALFDGERGLLSEYNWHSANRHTEELMPAVDVVLGSAGVTSSAIAAVGVALGPGSFSGLRVGLAAAKGLALATGISLIGVPTLDITAYPHQGRPGPLIAVVQAGRGRVYYAPYGHGVEGWTPQSPYTLGTVADIAGQIVSATTVVGELPRVDRETLAKLAGEERVTFLPSSQNIRRAGCLAELAWRRFEAGKSDDASTLSPLYLQQPEGAKSGGLSGSAMA